MHEPPKFPMKLGPQFGQAIYASKSHSAPPAYSTPLQPYDRIMLPPNWSMHVITKSFFSSSCFASPPLSLTILSHMHVTSIAWLIVLSLLDFSGTIRSLIRTNNIKSSEHLTAVVSEAWLLIRSYPTSCLKPPRFPSANPTRDPVQTNAICKPLRMNYLQKLTLCKPLAHGSCVNSITDTNWWNWHRFLCMTWGLDSISFVIRFH